MEEDKVQDYNNPFSAGQNHKHCGVTSFMKYIQISMTDVNQAMNELPIKNSSLHFTS